MNKNPINIIKIGVVRKMAKEKIVLAYSGGLRYICFSEMDSGEIRLRCHCVGS